MYQSSINAKKKPGIYLNQADGMVRELRQGKALVITDRKTMCGQCVAKGFCHMLGGGKEMVAEALNPIDAQIGDMVKVGIPSGTVTKASLVVYMIPATGLVIGATLGYYVGTWIGYGINLFTLIGCLVFGAGSMMLVRLLGNILSKQPSYQPEIIKIINPANKEVPG